MNDQPDLSKLARQYLDLWESQLTAMSADPDLAEQSARFFEAMTQLSKDVKPMLTANFTEFFNRAQPGTRNAPDPSFPAADRTSSAPSTPGDRDEWVDQLTRRLTALEKRLDQLESGTGKKGGGTASRTRAKPRNTKPKKS